MGVSTQPANVFDNVTKHGSDPADADMDLASSLALIDGVERVSWMSVSESVKVNTTDPETLFREIDFDAVDVSVIEQWARTTEINVSL